MIKEHNFRLNTAHERLKYLRSLTRLERTEISERHDMPEITLRSYENAKLPLSEKGLRRCLDIYRKEGVIVTDEWLRSGIGPNPILTFFSFPHSNQYPEEALQRDIQYFKQSYPNSLIITVQGPEMLPIYQEGDIVGGVSYLDNFSKYNNYDCIASLESGIDIFRKLTSTENGILNLISINPLMTFNSILFNAQITKLTPILWHLKKPY